LDQSEVHKRELEENFLANVKKLIRPYIESLKKSRLGYDQKELLRTVEANLNKIASPFLRRISLEQYDLTPKEIRVANLVKIGKKNKEIAKILGLSYNTILFHRFNIRTKLGIRNKDINLRSHLESFDK
jgi:DNA-binding CsgD family transcriptional regulator